MKSLLVIGTLMIMSSTAFSRIGAEGGGGGGGVCINGKCMTLAEAGFRIINEDYATTRGDTTRFKPAAIPREVVEEAQRISVWLPLYNTYLDKAVKASFDAFSTDMKLILHPITSFYPVERNESVNIDIITDTYMKLLAQNNFPTDNFKLFAFSNHKATYILPEFYKLPSLSAKSIIYLHESYMRSMHELKRYYSQYTGMNLDWVSDERLLTNALQLDQFYWDLVNNNPNIDPAPVVRIINEYRFFRAMVSNSVIGGFAETMNQAMSVYSSYAKLSNYVKTHSDSRANGFKSIMMQEPIAKYFELMPGKHTYSQFYLYDKNPYLMEDLMKYQKDLLEVLVGLNSDGIGLIEPFVSSLDESLDLTFPQIKDSYTYTYVLKDFFKDFCKNRRNGLHLTENSQALNHSSLEERQHGRKNQAIVLGSSLPIVKCETQILKDIYGFSSDVWWKAK